jgi:AraC-like DNA-binding protein
MPVIESGKCLRPLKNYRFHSHGTWEIILNLEGSGSDIIGESEYPFFPGSIICIPPNMPHSKVSNEQFKDIYIQSTEFMVSNRPEVLRFQDDEEKSIEMLMQLAYRTFHMKEKYCSNTVDSLYDAIQYTLFGRMESPVKNRSIEQLVRLIVENFSDPEFSVSDTASELPYCSDYIRKLFKKETGMTPVSYLNGLRLEHAKRLLKQQPITDYSIGEIALMCGFYDPRYFSRLFKQHTNRTPMQYVTGR